MRRIVRWPVVLLLVIPIPAGQWGVRTNAEASFSLGDLIVATVDPLLLVGAVVAGGPLGAPAALTLVFGRPSSLDAHGLERGRAFLTVLARGLLWGGFVVSAVYVGSFYAGSYGSPSWRDRMQFAR